MSLVGAMPGPGRDAIKPRARILDVAHRLFYSLGLRGVGMDAIARAAGTNKVTIYRHFSSKDDLVAHWLEGLAQSAQRAWQELAARHAGDPLRQIVALVDMLAESDSQWNRGCPFANAIVEMPEPDHPARSIVQAHKQAQYHWLLDRCRELSCPAPETLADALFFTIEGAQICDHVSGAEEGRRRLAAAVRLIVASHLEKQSV